MIRLEPGFPGQGEQHKGPGLCNSQGLGKQNKSSEKPAKIRTPPPGSTASCGCDLLREAAWGLLLV